MMQFLLKCVKRKTSSERKKKNQVLTAIESSEQDCSCVADLAEQTKQFFHLNKAKNREAT